MAENIKQTFEIDASQAINSIIRLNGAYETLDKHLETLTKRIKSFNGDASKIVDSLKPLPKAIEDSSREVQKLTVGFATLSRVVATQLIVRTMSQIRDAIKETASTAADFQKQVALTTTIADGASFDQVASAARDLSDSFNIDLLKTTEGLYQALSNQVGNFGESLQFTSKAAQFAKATGSSLADSVDLLSAALKSYGLGVEDTDKVSSIFFTAIDKGRLTASELGNALGRVLPIASEMGLSLEEIGASLSSMSVKGLKTSETITQLRSIVSAFQKPSETMAATLRELGFTSGEAAIRQLTLAGALDQLAKSAGGSNEQFAKLFPNIRGLAGATSLTSDGLKSFANDLREMESASRNFNKEKFLQATATDAENVTKNINALKNAFTVDLGQAVLKSASDLIDWSGGTDTLKDAAGGAGGAIIGLSGAITLLGGQLAASRSGLASLSKLFSGLALASGAAGLGDLLGSKLGNFLSNNLLKDLKEQEKIQAEQLDNLSKSLAEQRDKFIKADSDRVRKAEGLVGDLQKLYLRDVDNATVAAKLLAANSKAAFAATMEDRKRLVNELSRAATESTRIAEQATKRIADLQSSSADRAFGLSIAGRSDPEKVFALSKRAQELASEASSLMAKANGDAGQIAKANAQFQAAERLAEQAGSLSGDSRLQLQAAKALESITATEISAQQRLAEFSKQQKVALDSRRAIETEVTEQLRQQTIEQVKQLEAGTKAEAIARANATFRATAPGLAGLEKFSGKQIDTPDQLRNVLTDAKKSAAEIRAELDKSLLGDARGDALKAGIDTLFNELKQRDSTRNLVPGQFSDGLRAQYAGVIQQLETLRTDSQITTEELSKVIEARNKLGQAALAGDNPLVGGLGFSESIQAMDVILAKFSALRTIQAQSPTQYWQQQLQNVDSVLNTVSEATSTIEQRSTAIAEQWERAARAAASIGSGGGGNVPHFATGGRGMDTIAAMLSPGEMVINPKSTGKFFSQLQAMNAGVQPVYRADGGSVDNSVKVGDISITGGVSMNARDVAKAIGREVRRGNVK